MKEKKKKKISEEKDKGKRAGKRVCFSVSRKETKGRTTCKKEEAMPSKNAPLPVQWGWAVRQRMKIGGVVLAQQAHATDTSTDGAEVWAAFSKCVCEAGQSVRFPFARALFGNEQTAMTQKLSTADYSLFLLQLRDCCQIGSYTHDLVEVMKSEWDNHSQRPGVEGDGDDGLNAEVPAQAAKCRDLLRRVLVADDTIQYWLDRILLVVSRPARKNEHGNTLAYQWGEPELERWIRDVMEVFKTLAQAQLRYAKGNEYALMRPGISSRGRSSHRFAPTHAGKRITWANR